MNKVILYPPSKFDKEWIDDLRTHQIVDPNQCVGWYGAIFIYHTVNSRVFIDMDFLYKTSEYYEFTNIKTDKKYQWKIPIVPFDEILEIPIENLE